MVSPWCFSPASDINMTNMEDIQINLKYHCFKNGEQDKKKKYAIPTETDWQVKYGLPLVTL